MVEAGGLPIREASVLFLAAAAGLSLLPTDPPVVCPLRTLTRIPCPFCGGTTSVLATMRVEPGRALAANPLGLVLVLAASWIVLGGRTDVPVPGPRALTAGTLALWLFELRRFGLLRWARPAWPAGGGRITAD